MKRRNAIGVLLAAGVMVAPGLAWSQDGYTFQVEVTNNSKRLVYVGTGYKKAYKPIKPGSQQNFEITISSSDCKNAKEFEVDISDTQYPLDSRNIYAYLLYLYEWNSGTCYFSYIGNKSINTDYEIVDGGEVESSDTGVTRQAAFEPQ